MRTPRARSVRSVRSVKSVLAALTASALSVAAVLAAAGCGAADEPGDGRIILYSGRSESLISPVLAAFERASGIDVEVRYGDTAAMAAQLLEEGDGSPADAFLAQDAGALGAVSKRGLFARLPAGALGRVAERYRAASGQWVGVTGRSRVLVYNSDMVPESDLPESVFELTGPKWRGKVGVAPTNGSFQAFVTALRVRHGDARAREFLTGLKAGGAQVRDSNIRIVADVDAGKLAAGLVNHYYVYARAAEDGTTVDALKARLHFFPDGDTGGLVNVSGVGVLRKAASDPDTLALVDYLLGEPAQRLFAQRTYEYPLVPGVPIAPGLPPLAELEAPEIDLNDLDTLQETVAMIKQAGLA